MGRSTTNILLAIIAGCLLFGSDMVLSSLKVVGIVALVIVVIIVVGVIVLRGIGMLAFPVIDTLIKHLGKAPTPIRKTAILLAYLFALYLVAAVIASFLYSFDHNGQFGRGADDMLASEWGKGLAVIAVAVVLWFGGLLVGNAIKRMFPSPQTAYRIDAIGTLIAGFATLPIFLAFRAKDLRNAYYDFLLGVFVWFVVLFVILLCVFSVMMAFK